MQEELADTLGITLVHMKQMLQALHSRNFIATRQTGTH
jgi:transcription initiation factor IIE alpha subunit